MKEQKNTVTKLVHGLRLNKISEENIAKLLKLKEIAEELGWKLDDYDGIDGDFLVTFSVKK